MAPVLAYGAAILSLAAQITAAPTAAGAPADAADAAVVAAALEQRTFSQYAPKPAACPSGPLVRNADSISSQEQAYLSKRAPKAAAALKSWLSKIDSTYSSASKLPTVALAHSGGGLRSLLISAGVTQAFDAREGSGKMAGLLQGLTYQGGISGGAWFVSSMYGNNYPTVSYLQKTLWTDAFAQSLIFANIFHPSLKGSVATDVLAKDLAGYETGLVDIYGRLVSYQLFTGPDGGVSNTLSGITQSSNYTNYNLPFPVLNGIGLDTFRGACSPSLNSTIYEFTPYEFGSWGPGVAAFTPASSLGSNLNNGKASNGKCVSGFDNLGFVLGTSSDVLFAVAAGQQSCGGNQSLANSPNATAADPGLASIVSGLEDVLGAVSADLDSNLYASYPNPFKGYAASSHVSQLDTLELIDGGSSGLNVPVDPFVQPARAVDVLLINDNSADTAAHLPNGSSVYLQYTQSGPDALNLPKMPAFPDPATVIARGLDKMPSAYGCNDASKTTLVYIPNHNWTFADAGESTYKIQYSPSDSAAMIKNGNAVAYYNGTADWPTCLSCLIMKKSAATLPVACQGCFTKYCQN